MTCYGSTGLLCQKMSENALLLVLLMSAVSSFVFLLLDPDHHEGTRSAYRDICVWSVKGV